MTNIEEMIKNSKCFGLAYDKSVKECKICEVKLKCESKCRLGVGETPKKPDSVSLADKDEISMTDEAMEKSKAKEKDVTAKKLAKTKEKKPTAEYDPSMPEFKSMSIEDMETLLVERGGDLADFEKYTNKSIRKMRLTMYLKKTYEIKK